MNQFFIKYKNGESAWLPAKREEQDGLRVTLAEEVDYKQMEYAELTLHEEELRAGDEGFFLVGSGHGKCINKDYGIGYFREREDCEEVLRDCYMPVFGIKHGETCHVSIVTGMGMDIAQVIFVKDNVYTIKVRFLLDGMVPYEPMEVLFIPLHKENATYSGMARAYRAHQLKKGFLPLKDKLTGELAYSVKSINVRIRMAWKPVPCQIHEQTPETEPPVHVACTFEDVVKVMEAYHKAGLRNVEFCLVGWNMKGHDGRWPQILPVESSIGGEAGLRKVIDKANELGYAMTCHTNSTDMYAVSNRFCKEDIQETSQGEKSVEATYWAGGRTYNICPKRAYEISTETLPEVADLGFRGMHYIDVITCTPPRACYSKSHPVNKRESVHYFDKLFEEATKMFGSIGCEGAYDHYLKNCHYTLYASFGNFAKKEEMFHLCDQTIPFWQLVYHGIVPSNPYASTVNYAISENKDDFLKVVEYGGKPQMYYYAKFVSDGGDWIGKGGDLYCNTDEQIAFSAQKAKETEDGWRDLAYLQYEFMENHEEIAPGVFETTYSDGSVTQVDYNQKTYILKRGK